MRTLYNTKPEDIWALKAYDWPQEYRELITWFYGNQDKLPRQTFTLQEYDMPWSRTQKGWLIDKPDQFYDVMKADIGVGPNHHPTTSGMLLYRLKLIKDLVYNPPPRVEVEKKNQKAPEGKTKKKKHVVTQDELNAVSIMRYQHDEYGEEL